MIVDLVSVTTRDGIRLDGTWRQPHLEDASQLGVDVVIFHYPPARLCLGRGAAVAGKGLTILCNRGGYP